MLCKCGTGAVSPEVIIGSFGFGAISMCVAQEWNDVEDGCWKMHIEEG